MALPNTLTVGDLTDMFEVIPTPFRVPVVLVPADMVLCLNTCDGGNIARVFEYKLEEAYAIEDFIDSLRNEGFLLPVTLCNGNYRHDTEWVLGNGNHRTATALALGYEFIPFALVEGSTMDTFEFSDGPAAQRAGLVLDRPIYHEPTGPDTYRSPWIDILREGGLVE